jgi:hypothetical protein
MTYITVIVSLLCRTCKGYGTEVVTDDYICKDMGHGLNKYCMYCAQGILIRCNNVLLLSIRFWVVTHHVVYS